jgi:hypothetical protein
MTKFRTILLNFVRWRERRAWKAQMRWQRASWQLHGINPKKPNPDGSDYFLRPSWRAVDHNTIDQGERK